MEKRTKLIITILGMILLVASIYFVSAAISPITPSLNLDGQNQFTISNYDSIQGNLGNFSNLYFGNGTSGFFNYSTHRPISSDWSGTKLVSVCDSGCDFKRLNGNSTDSGALDSLPYILNDRYYIQVNTPYSANEDVFIPIIFDNSITGYDNEGEALKINGNSTSFSSQPTLNSITIFNGNGKMTPIISGFKVLGISPVSDEDTGIISYGGGVTGIKNINFSGSSATIGVVAYSSIVDISCIDLGNNDLDRGFAAKHAGTFAFHEDGCSAAIGGTANTFGSVLSYVFSNNGGLPYSFVNNSATAGISLVRTSSFFGSPVFDVSNGIQYGLSSIADNLSIQNGFLNVGNVELNQRRFGDISSQYKILDMNLNSENNFNNFVLDSSSYNTHGINSGATFIYNGGNISDGAFYFDSVTDSIDLQKNFNFGLNSNFTFMIETYINSTADGSIFGRRDSSGAILSLDVKSNEIELQFGNISGTRQYVKTPLVTNRSINLIITFDGTLTKMYLDGLLVDTETSLPSEFRGDSNFNLGQRGGVSYNSIIGYISKFTVYNRTLNYDEVKIINNNKIDPLNSYVSQRYVRVDSNGNVNVTQGNLYANLSWNYLSGYPVACPAGSYLTQLDDSVTCTAITDIPNNATTQSLFPITNALYELGNSTLSWIKGWFVDLDVSGSARIENINNTGNASINNYYGAAYYNNETATTITFAVDGTYYPLFLTDSTDLNGFTFSGGFNAGGNLTAEVAGIYQVTYMAIGSGQNNEIYRTSIFVNGVDKPECANIHKMTAGGDILTQNGICLITLAVGDDVEIKTADIGGTGDGEYYGANLNILRIGN